jgi:hypothetical protein
MLNTRKRCVSELSNILSTAYEIKLLEISVTKLKIDDLVCTNERALMYISYIN